MKSVTALRGMMWIVMVVAVLGFIGSAARAEEGSGTPSLAGMTSDAEGAPLADVEVIVLELKREVRTGADGRYQFSDIPAGHYTVSFQRLGYAAVTERIVLPMTTPLDAKMTANVLVMPPVEVTGTRAPRPTLDSPLSISFLPEEKLERETSVSLSHAIERLPGVRTVSTGAQIGKPMIRGLTGARVLVLDNGHRLEDYSWSDEDGPSIDPASGERVEVIRGPASLMYGSDALSGVVNLVVPELPETEPGQGSFIDVDLAGYYASNSREGGALIGAHGASGDLGWMFRVNGRKAEAIHTPEGELENTGFSAVTGDAGIGMHGDKGNVSVRYARYGGEFKLLEANGPPPGEEEGEEEGPERKSADDRVQVDGDLVAGSLRFEGRFQWQQHSLIELSDEVPIEPSGKPSGTPASRLDTEAAITRPASTAEKKEKEAFNLLLNTTSLDLLAHHRLGSHIHGTAGLGGFLQTNDTMGPIPLVPDATINSGDAFLYEEARFGNFSLLGGARGDVRSMTADPNEDLGIATEQERDWTEFSGDAGIVFRPGNDLALAVNVGRSFRAPTLFELYANGPQIADARYLIGDSDLEAEHGLNFDGGIRWQSSRIHGEVAGYVNQIDDFISLYPTGGTMADLPVYEYRATDAVLTGAEVGLGVQVVGPLSLNGEFDWVMGEEDENGDPLPLIPPVRGLVGAGLDWTDLSWADRFSAAIDVDIVGEKTHLVENEIGSDSYVLVGGEIDLVEHLGGREWDFSLRVKNAADESYADFLSRYKAFALNAGRDVIVRLGTHF